MTIDKKYYNSDVEIDLNETQFLSIQATYNEFDKNIQITFNTMDVCPKTNTVSTMFFGDSIHRYMKVKQLPRKNSKLIAKAKDQLIKIDKDILLEIFNNNDKQKIKDLIVI